MNICPSTLAEGYADYSPVAQKKLFSSKKVSSILPFDSPETSDKVKADFLQNRSFISISGVQSKVAITQDGKTLRLSQKGEQSTHILKPAVQELLNGKYTCANEHLTMQIVSQVFGIETAENGLCFFKNGEPAYITRRFDVTKDGKLKMEDFASIAGKSQSDGNDFKYDFSYEELGKLIRDVIPSWKVEIEKYFKLILFNYLFSNGDAHLKNFSVIQTSSGDYKLSPAYDLMNTSLHIFDKTFALKKGLFKDKVLSFVGRDDFVEFGLSVGCMKARIEKIMTMFLLDETETQVSKLIDLSFLSVDLKAKYKNSFLERKYSLI